MTGIAISRTTRPIAAWCAENTCSASAPSPAVVGEEKAGEAPRRDLERSRGRGVELDDLRAEREDAGALHRIGSVHGEVDDRLRQLDRIAFDAHGSGAELGPELDRSRQRVR